MNSSPAVSAASVERFEQLWTKLPGKALAGGVEFLPTQLAVQVLARSQLPREWLKEIWTQSRAGNARAVPGLDKEAFVLACVLTAICKGHAGHAEFPWAAVTEALVGFGRLKGINLLGISDDLVASAPTPLASQGGSGLPKTQLITPAISHNLISTPSAASPSPFFVPAALPQLVPSPIFSPAPSPSSPARRPVPPPPLPQRSSIEDVSTVPNQSQNPFKWAPDEDRMLQQQQQLLSDEDLAWRLQAEEDEELSLALAESRIASEAEEAARRAAQEAEEAERRRAMELQDEELARQLQAEEEALSVAQNATESESRRSMSRPDPVPVSRPAERQDVLPPSWDTSTATSTSTTNTGIAFEFYPGNDLMLPMSYLSGGGDNYGVKRAEPDVIGQVISEDIYIQYGPRDRDVRSDDQPLLWIHFFFNDADTARRCRNAWPRKGVVFPGMGLSLGGFKLPLGIRLESASKGFESGAADRMRRQHVFVLKRAGDQLAPNMLNKLNAIVADIIRDPSMPVSLAERGGTSLARNLSVTTASAPRPNISRNTGTNVSRSATMPSGTGRNSQILRDVGLRPHSTANADEPPPPYSPTPDPINSIGTIN